MKSYVSHTPTEIFGFFDDYRFLSNFHKCPVMFDGIKYPSSENAFMAAKTLDPDQRIQFEDLEPSEAKAVGRKIQLRPDWESVKFEIMSAIVFDKFYRNRSIRKKLLETGSANLVEANHWGDRIWGTDETGEGRNALGQILMNVREFWSNVESIKNRKL